MMYRQGKGGVQQDKDEALTWFQKSADQGYEAAQTELTALNAQTELKTLNPQDKSTMKLNSDAVDDCTCIDRVSVKKT